MNLREQQEQCAFGILEGLRKVISRSELDLSRFPNWFEASNIRIGSLRGERTIFLFEPSQADEDKITEYQTDQTESQFILNMPESPTEGAAVFALGDSEDFEEILPIIGTRRPNQGIVKFGDGLTSFTELKEGHEYHRPIVFSDMAFQWTIGETVMATRIVPFGVIISNQDLAIRRLLNRLLPSIYGLLDGVSISYTEETGQEENLGRSLEANAKETVIVLGSYSSPHKRELKQVRDELRLNGYDANLIEDLGSLPQWSVPDKVRIWRQTCRFCTVVDRVPSGHLIEYSELKDMEKILACLQPTGSKSTWMTQGDKHRHRFIECFEFTGSPLESLDSAVKWAEDQIDKRIQENQSEIPW